MLKEKIVLDTNCLVMSLSAHNPYAEIWQKFVKGEYILCVSNDILEEYEEVLGRNITQSSKNCISLYSNFA